MNLASFLIVCLALVSTVCSKSASVTTNLNVRTGPSLQYNVLDVTTKGRKYRVEDEVDGWYKIDHFIYSARTGRYFVRKDEIADRTQSEVMVALYSLNREFVSNQTLNRNNLKVVNWNEVLIDEVPFLRVALKKVGWISSEYTIEIQTNTELAKALTDKVKPVEIQTKSVSVVKKTKPPVEFIQTTANTVVFLDPRSKNTVGMLNDTTIYQVIGDDNEFYKIAAEASDLQDTIFIDLNEYYDLNSGETIDINFLRNGKLIKKSTVNKKNIRFDSHQARFGSGMARLVPANIKLPFWVKKKGVKNTISDDDMNAALRKKIATHPIFFFSESIAKYIESSLDSVPLLLKHNWFISGQQDSLLLGLNLNTSKVFIDSLVNNEVIFNQFVKPVVLAVTTEIKSMDPFSSFVITVQYNNKTFDSRGYGRLKSESLTFNISTLNLIELKYENITLAQLFKIITVKADNV